MDEINRFEEMIYCALGSVDDSYYKTTYNNIENFKNAFFYRTGRIVGNDFERYAERVFCYEFYHQLRILISKEEIKSPNFLNKAKLQGEVEKMQIIELNEKLGLSMLDGEYAPDFLMHSPGNADYHPYVIEIKCVYDISPSSVYKDLRKINEFITKYGYQKGAFISINSDPEYINGVLVKISRGIEQLEGRNRIKVLCKKDQKSQLKIWEL